MSTPNIPVESNIPPPDFVPHGRPEQYPWHDMAVGDSFLYRARGNYSQLRSACSVARQASKRVGKKFRAAYRYEDNVRTIRIWRVG